ncbi:MAG: histidine--tRNA ligase [Bacteroidetes bacterium]|nr:histidine--tRNA ligase [Bacteroidota bacterium]
MSEDKKERQNFLQAPRGMRDLEGTSFYNHQGFFEKAQEICEYYGFSPIRTPVIEHEEIFLKSAGEGTDIVDKEMYTFKTGGTKFAMRPEGTAGVMRAYIEHGMQNRPQPVKFYYCESFFRHDKPQKGRYREFDQFGIEVMGSDKSVLDAMVIKIALVILKEAGIENIRVKINSIGDTESRKDYVKELTNYYKKFLGKMSATDRDRMKTNPLRILDSKDEKLAEINASAPQSVSHLNAASKKHFKEVLEYLNEMNIDYELDHTLVRGLDYYSHTVFEFFTDKKEEGEERELALGGGGRYDYLAKSMGHKKNIPGIGFGLGVDRILEASGKDLIPKIKRKEKVYFIQLGNEAKMKSLNVIEILRQAKIGVNHSLSKDSLGSQLSTAEKMGFPYTLIFGQKEALENSVLVRDMENRSQKTVSIDKLSEYLKKLK